jgi:hypothetical protein
MISPREDSLSASAWHHYHRRCTQVNTGGSGQHHKDPLLAPAAGPLKSHSPEAIRPSLTLINAGLASISGGRHWSVPFSGDAFSSHLHFSLSSCSSCFLLTSLCSSSPDGQVSVALPLSSLVAKLLHRMLMAPSASFCLFHYISPPSSPSMWRLLSSPSPGPPPSQQHSSQPWYLPPTQMSSPAQST